MGAQGGRGESATAPMPVHPSCVLSGEKEMEYETGIARDIASGKRGRGQARAKMVAISMVGVFALSVFVMVPGSRADFVLLDEVNLGDPATEGDRIESWSGIWSPVSNPVNPGSSPGGWGGFDPEDPYPHDAAYSRAHNLRTTWAATEGAEDSGASVTLYSKVSAKLIEIRALDGAADDGFQVYVNGRLTYSYTDEHDTETWVTHQIPVRNAGAFEVKIVPTGDPWSGITSWGQLGVNWIKLYGVGGFDMYGYNYDARLYIGWYLDYDRYAADGTGDAWLIMKWSDDWVIQGDCPVGAWVTNHFVWYSDDYAEDTWFGWDTRATWNNEVTPDTEYVVEEFMKVMRVSDDPEAWAEYEAGGAFGVWGAYPSGVPNFVVLQDTVRVFSAESGELIESYELCLTKPWGLGQPIF